MRQVPRVPKALLLWPGLSGLVPYLFQVPGRPELGFHALVCVVPTSSPGLGGARPLRARGAGPGSKDLPGVQCGGAHPANQEAAAASCYNRPHLNLLLNGLQNPPGTRAPPCLQLHLPPSQQARL